MHLRVLLRSPGDSSKTKPALPRNHSLQGVCQCGHVILSLLKRTAVSFLCLEVKQLYKRLPWWALLGTPSQPLVVLLGESAHLWSAHSLGLGHGLCANSELVWVACVTSELSAHLLGVSGCTFHSPVLNL